MAVLSLIGITGIYLRQVRQTGVLGLIGYLVLGVGYLATPEHPDHRLCSSCRSLRPASPAMSTTSSPWPSGTPVGDIGPLQTLIKVAGFTYIAGGILFGIALFRAGVLARWAAALLAVGAVATSPPSGCPSSLQRLFAIPARRRPGRPRLLPVARAAHPRPLGP